MASKKAKKQSITEDKVVNLKKIIQPSYRNLIIGFAVLAVILVMTILYFALSQATITVTPVFQDQPTGFAVQIVDKNLVEEKNLSSGRLLGEIKETVAEAAQEFSATSFQVTDAKAGGAITIINNYSNNQPLVATTRFLTPDNKLYRLVSGVTAPAGGQIMAQVLADQAGEEYEIGPNQLTIPGLWEGLQDKIYGETQGFARQIQTKYVVTQNNIHEAAASLKEQLINQAMAELSQNLSSQQSIAPADLVVEILKYTASAEPETETEKFSIAMSLGIKAVIFDRQKLEQTALNDLPDIYQQNDFLIKVNPESLNYEVTLLDENAENLIAQVKGSYIISVANVQIDKTALKGLAKPEAEKYLMSLGNIEKVSIRLPFWTRYLPTLADHIDIRIKQ